MIWASRDHVASEAIRATRACAAAMLGGCGEKNLPAETIRE
jgi:hypothetical protein